MMDLHEAPGKHRAVPNLVTAGDLTPGQMIRDRGRLHTIHTVDPDAPPVRGSVTVTMEDGARLVIPSHQDVTVWTEAN